MHTRGDLSGIGAPGEPERADQASTGLTMKPLTGRASAGRWPMIDTVSGSIATCLRLPESGHRAATNLRVESPCRAAPSPARLRWVTFRTDRDEIDMGEIVDQSSGCRCSKRRAGTGVSGRRYRGRAGSRLRATRPPLRAKPGIRPHPQPRYAPRIRRMGSEPRVLTGEQGPAKSTQARRPQRRDRPFK